MSINSNSQKEKEAKRKNPMRLWILPLMGKLMDNLAGSPQFPQSLGSAKQHGGPTVPTITRLLRSCSFVKNQKTGHFYFGKNRTFLFWLDNNMIYACSL
jgi:hypothetical protein